MAAYPNLLLRFLRRLLLHCPFLPLFPALSLRVRRDDLAPPRARAPRAAPRAFPTPCARSTRPSEIRIAAAPFSHNAPRSSRIFGARQGTKISIGATMIAARSQSSCTASILDGKAHLLALHHGDAGGKVALPAGPVDASFGVRLSPSALSHCAIV